LKTNFKFRACAVLIGAVLGLQVAPSENTIIETSKAEATYQHLWNTKEIETVQVSPDNKHVFVTYNIPQIASSENGGKSSWDYKFSVIKNYKDNKKLAEKIFIPEVSAVPSWTPDSTGISYLAPGEKSASLWVQPIADSKPQKIFEAEDNILGYQWAPNGKKIAILMNKNFPKKALKFVYDVDKNNLMKLYILDVNDKGKVSSVTPLTPDIIMPRVYDGNYSQSFSWTSDSQNIVYSFYSASKETGDELAQLDVVKIATKENKTLAVSEEGTHLFPLVSPDGIFVAYVTNSLPKNTKNPIRIYGTDASRVCLINLQNHEKKCLAKTPNENPQLIGWKHDSQSVFVVDQLGNHSQMYELGLDGQSISKFTTGQQTLKSMSINQSGETIGYAAGDFSTPAEAYVTSVDSFKPEKLTGKSFPFSRANETRNVIIENVMWKSKDKKFDLEGIFVYKNKDDFPRPLITILNDYSKTASALDYMGDFTIYPISPLSLLEKGYALFIPNRRGTNGYGIDFRQAIYKELGGEELQDVLTGIDTLIEQKKADPHKLALWGWGYGGYLSAWAMTQTDRFKTVVVASGIANLISQVGTSTEPAILEAIMGEPFWKDWTTWREKSPISHVKSMKTPAFIQTIEETGYIRHSQSEELFFPLRSRNLPVEMITYQVDGHTFSNPDVTLMAIQDLEKWLDKYVAPQNRQEP
jgi:dipeptidyl aminopeptidase/acylaminoacyl peptidase